MDCFAALAMTVLETFFFQIRLPTPYRFPSAVLYDIHHFIFKPEAPNGRPDPRDRRITPPGGLLHRASDRGARWPRRHRDAGDQYPAAVATADGGFAECDECCGNIR